MLVLGNAHSNNWGERAVVSTLRDLGPGLVLANVFVPPAPDSRGRPRETDAVVLCPQGVLCLEVKGTAMKGNLVASPNAPWTINGDPADFHGGPNPCHQARKPAQMLADSARKLGLQTGYVRAVVVVTGEVHVGHQDLGVIGVSDIARLPALVEAGPRVRWDRSSLLGMLALLGITELDEPVNAVVADLVATRGDGEPATGTGLDEDLPRPTKAPASPDLEQPPPPSPPSGPAFVGVDTAARVPTDTLSVTVDSRPSAARNRVRDIQDGCSVSDLEDGTYLILSKIDGRSARVRDTDYKRDARPLHWLDQLG